MISEKLTALARLVEKHATQDGLHETGIAKLRCLKFSDPGSGMPTVYQPSVCVVLQGSKEVLVENRTYSYSPSDFLVVSVDMPVIGRVTRASAAEPYLCVTLDIDAQDMSELIAQMDGVVAEEGDSAVGVFVAKVDTPLLDSVLRLVGLLDTPKDIPLLGPLAMREVYYRLLQGDHGRRIAQIAITGSTTQRIAQVLQVLKTNVAKPMRVEELAGMAGMSLSSFHHHFKQVTTMSPLQYLKRLRLWEARRILIAEAADAASTAYRVGYESPSQFSREYSRLFGAPPRRDVEMIRQGGL